MSEVWVGAGVKVDIRRDEHLRIKNDSRGVGFLLHVAGDEIHVRAKSPDEPDAYKTTVVFESNVEVVK